MFKLNFNFFKKNIKIIEVILGVFCLFLGIISYLFFYNYRVKMHHNNYLKSQKIVKKRDYDSIVDKYELLQRWRAPKNTENYFIVYLESLGCVIESTSVLEDNDFKIVKASVIFEGDEMAKMEMLSELAFLPGQVFIIKEDKKNKDQVDLQWVVSSKLPCNESLGDKKQIKTIELAMDGLFLESKDFWVLWINGERYTPERRNITKNIYIDEINHDYITIIDIKAKKTHKLTLYNTLIINCN